MLTGSEYEYLRIVLKNYIKMNKQLSVHPSEFQLELLEKLGKITKDFFAKYK
jgi:hypothetical protein